MLKLYFWIDAFEIQESICAKVRAEVTNFFQLNTNLDCLRLFWKSLFQM